MYKSSVVVNFEIVNGWQNCAKFDPIRELREREEKKSQHFLHLICAD
jgi:hypothetical protein